MYSRFTSATLFTFSTITLLGCTSSTTSNLDRTVDFASVNGTSLYYEIQGEGDPIVFLEGGNLDLRMWDEQFDVFAEQHKVVRYDVRGFGQSAPKGDPYLEHEDLRALLDHLSIDQAYLVGLSMGGGISLDFALAYPERVKALVLAGPGLSGFRFSGEGDVFMQPVWDAMLEHDSLRAAELWLETPFMKPAMEQADLAIRLRQLALENARVWIPFQIEDPLRSDPAIDRLHEIQPPTLVIVGSRDYAEIHQIVQLLIDGVPGVEQAIIEGAGHMVNMEYPEEFNRLVSDFITKH